MSDAFAERLATFESAVAEQKRKISASEAEEAAALRKIADLNASVDVYQSSLNAKETELRHLSSTTLGDLASFDFGGGATGVPVAAEVDDSNEASDSLFRQLAEMSDLLKGKDAVISDLERRLATQARAASEAVEARNAMANVGDSVAFFFIVIIAVLCSPLS